MASDTQYSKENRNTSENKNGKGIIEKATGLLALKEDHEEGATTKAIENQTAKIPSGVYLALAVGSIALSAAFAVSAKRKNMANFVGLWAPTFLMLGVYNKIVKTHGSDAVSAT